MSSAYTASLSKIVDQCRVFVETHKHDVIECLGSCPCTAERIEAHIKDLEKDGMQDRAIKHIKELSLILKDEKKAKTTRKDEKGVLVISSLPKICWMNTISTEASMEYLLLNWTIK